MKLWHVRSASKRHDVRLGAILLLALGAMLSVQSASVPLEVDHYKYWSKLVVEGGIEAAYSGTFPQTYAIYPPFSLYFFWAAGKVYQALVDPAFQLQRALSDPTLTFLVKTPGMLFHLLTIALIYHWLRLRQSSRRAFIAATVYGLQPDVLFDVAVWGQPDPVHAFFVLLAAMLSMEGRPALGGAAYGIAAMTKPQAWALAPVLLIYVWRRYGWRDAGRAIGTSLVTALPLTLPFWLNGTWQQLLGLPRQIASVAPWVSVNAHNLWWIILGEHATAIADFTRTSLYRSWQTIAIGLILVSAAYCLIVMRPGERQATRGLLGILGLQSFAFFFLMTKAHENHAFMALPLLSLVWLRHRGLAVLYLAVSITFLLNLLLHDPGLAPQINTGLLGGQIKVAQSLNAWANLIVLLAWMTIVGLGAIATPRASRQDNAPAATAP